MSLGPTPNQEVRLTSSATPLSRRIAASAVCLVAAATLAACGSDTSAGSDPTSDPAILGPAKAATGTPLKIGYITDGKSSTIDFSALQQTAAAAVTYVNEHLGGVAGHPISLDICTTQQNPATATECANQMVKDGVPVVLNDLTGVGPSIVPVITQAKIPYLAFSGTTATELTTPGAYSMTGSIASFLGGLAAYSKQQGVTKVAVIGMNIPAVIQGVDSIGKAAFAKAGVGMTMVPVDPGTADLSPQIGSALSGHADALLVFGDSAICAGALKAAQSLGFEGRKYVVAQCVNKASATSIPGGWQGVTVSAISDLSPSDEEYRLYRAVLERYSPDTAAANATDSGAVEGYGAVLGFARIMAGVTSGDVTPTVVANAITHAKDVKLPVGGGLTFSCDGTAVPGLPGICSVGAQITTLATDGTPTAYSPIDASSLFAK